MRYLVVSFWRKRAGQIDEVVSLNKLVRNSDMKDANVILDFATNKIVKCVIEGKNHDTTFEKMRDYYAKIYPNLIQQLEKEAPITKDREKLEAKLAPVKKK